MKPPSIPGWKFEIKPVDGRPLPSNVATFGNPEGSGDWFVITMHSDCTLETETSEDVSACAPPEVTRWLLEGEEADPPPAGVTDRAASVDFAVRDQTIAVTISGVAETAPQGAPGEHGSLCGCGQCTGYDLPPCARCGAADHGLPACTCR